MSKRLVAGGLACAWLLATAAPHAHAQPAGPRLELETDHIDLGFVRGTAPVRARFPLRNTGTAPLEVMDLTASCGCVAALMSTPVLQPGERGEVAVSLDPTRIGDREAKIVTLYSNDPVRPVVFLKLAARAADPVRLSIRVLNFGTVPAGEGAEETFWVYQDPRAPLTLAGVMATSALLSFTWAYTPDASPPAYAVTARLAAGGVPGTFADTVRLTFREPDAPRIELPVRARVPGQVIATPPVLGLGLARRGSSPTRSVLLTAPTVSDFRVEKVESTSAHLVPTLMVAPDEAGYRVSLHVAQEAPRGALQALLRVYTNARDMPLVEVPVSAVIR